MIVGIDFDTYKAVLVGVPFDGYQPEQETIVFRKQSGDDAAVEALKRVRTMLLSSRLYYKADVFFIERGYGASRRSDFMMGAFFGLILATCAAAAPANLMLAAEWKREISGFCGVTTKDGRRGNGNLAKLDAHAYVYEAAERFGHDLDAYGSDALDAYAVALTGRWLNERAVG